MDYAGVVTFNGTPGIPGCTHRQTGAWILPDGVEFTNVVLRLATITRPGSRLGGSVGVISPKHRLGPVSELPKIIGQCSLGGVR